MKYNYITSSLPYFPSTPLILIIYSFIFTYIKKSLLWVFSVTCVCDSRTDFLLLDNQLGSSYQGKNKSPMSTLIALHLPSFLSYKRKNIQALVYLISHLYIYSVKAYNVQITRPFLKFNNPNTERINSLRRPWTYCVDYCNWYEYVFQTLSTPLIWIHFLLQNY